MKTHDDRVQDYLNKMDGLTMEEIVGSHAFRSATKKAKQPPQTEVVPPSRENQEIFGTPKQLAIVEHMRN